MEIDNVFSPVEETNGFNLQAEHLLEQEKKKGGMLPITIVFPVMVAASIWKAMVISLVGIAWQALIWAYIFVDKLWDTFVRVFIGSICKPCAWLFIWAFKLPTFPFIIFGWFFRIQIETMGALVSGWMLFFGGSGCYLRWGHNCWFSKRFKDRSYWEIADLTIWLRTNPSDFFVKNPELSFSESVHEFFQVPQIEDFNTEVARAIGENRRQSLADSCPLNRNTLANARAFGNDAKEFFGL